MRAYTDLIVLIRLRSGHHVWHHISRAKGIKRVAEVKYAGQRYDLDDSLAHSSKGWYPWIEFNWSGPFAILKYLAVVAQRKVGVLFYREPPKVLDLALPPIHISASGEGAYLEEEMPPALVKAYLSSPLYRNYQKGLSRMATGKQRIVIWVLMIGLLLLGILLLYNMGIIGGQQ